MINNQTNQGDRKMDKNTETLSDKIQGEWADVRKKESKHILEWLEVKDVKKAVKKLKEFINTTNMMGEQDFRVRLRIEMNKIFGDKLT